MVDDTEKKIMKKIAIALCSALCITLAGETLTANASTKSFDTPAIEVASDMGAGWNLGNALDAYNSIGGCETAWGNPVITKELIDTVKSAGFHTIRIPVTYMNRIGPALTIKLTQIG